MYTAGSGNVDFGAHTTYGVCNLCFLKVDVQITIGHPRDLINFAKGLTPSLNSVQSSGVIQWDTTDDKLPLFILSRWTAQRRQRKPRPAGLPSEQNMWLRIIRFFYEDLV